MRPAARYERLGRRGVGVTGEPASALEVCVTEGGCGGLFTFTLFFGAQVLGSSFVTARETAKSASPRDDIRISVCFLRCNNERRGQRSGWVRRDLAVHTPDTTAMFKLTKLTKAVTEALNAVPNVDELAKSMGAMEVDPRVVSEHGGVHSATCLAYEPTQRILAVGVDTGVKIICADGAEALLATPTHVEPARSVEFIAGVGRIVRLSSESGIDVLDLHSQRCLASTRWMKDATCVVGLRDSPFVMVGESTGCVRVAAVQHGPDGAGTLAPRSYKGEFICFISRMGN